MFNIIKWFNRLRLSKYQQTAKRILELEDNFNLEMRSFCSSHPFIQEKHERETTYCLAGWLAYLDGYPEEYRGIKFKHRKYSADLIGYSCYTDEWGFLFSANWSNSLEEAKKRAQYVLDNNSYPNKKCWKSKWGYSHA